MEGKSPEIYEVEADPRDERIKELEARLAESLAENAQLKEERDQYKKLATHDPLTELNNRRSFDLAVSNIFHESRVENKRENKKSWIFAILDIDNFKSINDQYGHDVGDVVLKEAAEFLQKDVGIRRSGDVLARFGGEEFVMLLKGCSAEDAMRKFRGKNPAESKNPYKDRYNKESGKTEFKFRVDGVDRDITFSAGVREFVPGEDVSFDQVYKDADAALYYSKEHGRNQITFHNQKVEDAEKE